MVAENIKRGLRVGLRVHEIGDATPYQLFFAAKGKSGASFGFMQGDLAAGQKDVTKTFKKAMQVAGMQGTVIDNLVARLSMHLISNPLSSKETLSVNAALQASSDLVDQMDERILQNVYDELDRTVATAQAAGREVDPKAQVYIALWINMSGPPTKLLEWLQGKDPHLPNPVSEAPPLVDGPAMEGYLRATSYYSQNPGNFPHMLASAAAGAAAIGELAAPKLAGSMRPQTAPVAEAAPGSASDETILATLADGCGLARPMAELIRFGNARGSPRSARYWAIANFDLVSSKPRLFLFDIQERQVEAYLCAHGDGSDGPQDDGHAVRFSDKDGSHCTSLGVYECAETYSGQHGFSMRLDGLQSTNSNARSRDIVVHGASYVSPATIEQTGRIGRSNGCLALENRYVTEVVTALNGGSLLLAWHSASMARANADHPEVWSEIEPPAHVAIPALEVADARDSLAALANRILNSPKIVLARKHAQTPDDDATAYLNIVDTAAGRMAHRSSYQTAPGGHVALDCAMLAGVLALAEDHSFSVSEFCGGEHSSNSRHYAGCAVDINTIDGRPVRSSDTVTAFQAQCRKLGATEVLGPGDPGHSTHVHAAWPRP
jgi:hypothetical protein